MLRQLIERLTSPQASLYLTGMMFCLPFIVAYHDIPIATFYGEWLAAALGLLALSGLLDKHFLQNMQIPRIGLVFLVLLFICNLQLLTDSQSSPQYGLLIQLYLLWAFLLAILGHYLFQRLGWEKIVNTLAIALVIAAAINAGFVVLQILQKLGFTIPIPKLHSYGMLAQSNQFGDFTALAMASLLYLYAKKRLHARVLTAGLLTGLLMLSLSGSRSSILYLVAIALLSFLLYMQCRHQAEHASTAKQILNISLFLLPFFFLSQLLITAVLPQELVQTPVARAMDAMGTPSMSLRWQFWQTSLSLFSQSPWLGIGAGQMRWTTYLLVDQPAINTARIFFEHSHNLLLHLFAEMGLFAGLALLSGLTLWAYGFFKKTTLHYEAWWLIGLLSIIGIHSMLEYPLWYTPFLGIFAFLLGAGEPVSLNLNRLSLSAQRLLKFALVAAIVYGAYQLYMMQIAYQKLESQIAVASQIDMSNVEKQTLVEDMIWVNEHSLLAPYAELVLATYINPNKTLTVIQTKLAESSLRFIPLRKPALNYVILLEMSDRHTEAIQHLNRIWLISGKNLKKDIQQMPLEHQSMLQNLLAEVTLKAAVAK